MILQDLANLLSSSVEMFASLDPVILYGLISLTFSLLVLGYIANIAGISTYVERKFAARVQQRIGPSEVNIKLWWLLSIVFGVFLTLVACAVFGYGTWLMGYVSSPLLLSLYLFLMVMLVVGGVLGYYALEAFLDEGAAFAASVVNLLVIAAVVTGLFRSLEYELLTGTGWFSAYGLNLLLLLGACALTVGMGYLGWVTGTFSVSVLPWDTLRPFGIFQFMADGLKLISKEDIIPSDADRPLFKLAPFIVFAGSFPLWAVIPMGEGVYAADMNIGLLYLFAVAGVTVIGILLAGWASGNKWSLYGAMRSAAQIVSYELPAGLTFLTIVMALGTLNLNTIIAEQSRNATPLIFSAIGLDLPGGFLNWFVFQYPPFTIVMFIMFFVSGVAEVNRAPFDLPESESELVAGFHTEYTGMRFALFFLAEYTNMFVIGVITSILFLGGWQPPYPGYVLEHIVPFLPVDVLRGFEGFFWFTIKGYFFVIVMMLMRWTLPRFRVDQLMHLAWKVMIPIAFINLASIGIWITLIS